MPHPRHIPPPLYLISLLPPLSIRRTTLDTGWIAPQPTNTNVTHKKTTSSWDFKAHFSYSLMGRDLMMTERLDWAGRNWTGTRPGKRKNRNHPRGFFPLIIIHCLCVFFSLDFFLFHIRPRLGAVGKRYPVSPPSSSSSLRARDCFFLLFWKASSVWQGKDTKVLGCNLGFD